MMWSTADIMTGLYIAVAVLLLIVLYHLIFIVVSLRKVMKRVDNVTTEIETVILKPLSMTDQAIEWVSGFLEGKKKHHKKDE